MPRMFRGCLLPALLCIASVAQAAEADIRRAVALLSDADTGNDAHAAAIMLREAEGGALDAQAYMVYLYDQGVGVPRDTAAMGLWEARIGAATGNDWRRAYDAIVRHATEMKPGSSGGDVGAWLKALGRSRWVAERLTMHGEQQIKKATAEIDALMKQQQEVDRQLAAAIKRSQMPVQSDPAVSPAATTRQVSTHASNSRENEMYALQAKALNGDVLASLDFAKRWHEGYSGQRNDMLCYFWTGMDPYSLKSVQLADACDDALSAEDRLALRAAAKRLQRVRALKSPPHDVGSAVESLKSWLTPEEAEAFRNTPRAQVPERHAYGWGVPVVYRFGLASGNTALSLAICGQQSCSTDQVMQVMQVILDRTWQALQ